MTAEAGAGTRATLSRAELPPQFERWRLRLQPGVRRPTSGAEWAGAIVLVERGDLDVECAAGGMEHFRTGDLLALGWLPLRTLHNRGTVPVELVAVRRRGPRRTAPFLYVTRPDPGGHHPMKFTTVIELGGKTATGFRVPDEIVASLESGKRPPVRVTIGAHTYRSTVAPMGGASWLPLSAENREAAGVTAGDEVEVRVELDTAPRQVTVPEDLAAALDADPEARRTFDGLSYSNQRWHVESIAGAKTDETRQRRLAKSVATLHDGRPR
jgi:Bacteriocin-protection, YdeI or OmpD-Associated/Domain of unknown function (DUF1905)